jgi:alkylation response protein AidB-like acyl-CoA dehydrogenase
VTPAEALDAAGAVADRLRQDVVERDRANGLPHRELALLRERGLLGLDPDDHHTTHAVTRIVAAADASIGHLLGYHYLHLWRAALYDNADLARSLRRAAAANGWFVAAASNSRGVVTARKVREGLSVSGQSPFATGAAVADRLLVGARREDDGARLVIVVRGGSEGISFPPGWDNLGQRLTASGGVVFDDVHVPLSDVLGVLAADADESSPRWPRLSLNSLAFQVVLAQVLAGIVEGALDEAARYTREHSRALPASGVARAVDDPYTLAAYGELAASARVARLAADDATDALAEADARGLALTATERGRTALAISTAKVVCTRVATDATSRIFELTGARSTARAVGLDRFWRDARTLTLHDPVAYKTRELGAHLLTGEYPQVTAYS